MTPICVCSAAFCVSKRSTSCLICCRLVRSAFRAAMRQLTDLAFIVTPRVYCNFTERVEFLDRHGKLFLEQVQQAGNARRAAGNVDAANIFTASGGTEEVEGLLNFQDQNVGAGAQ